MAFRRKTDLLALPVIADAAGYPHHIDFCWRLLIGLGAVPGAIALYFRLTLPETPRFTMDVERNVKQASTDVDAFLTTGGFVHDDERIGQRVEAPVATRRDFFAHFSKWENAKVLIGTSYSVSSLLPCCITETDPLTIYSGLLWTSLSTVSVSTRLRSLPPSVYVPLVSYHARRPGS